MVGIWQGWDGGTAGANPTTSSTGGVSGDPMTTTVGLWSGVAKYNAAAAYGLSPLGCRLGLGSGGTGAAVWTLPTPDDRYASGMLFKTNLPTGNDELISLRPVSGATAGVMLTAAGELEISAGGTIGGTSGAGITAGTWYYVEFAAKVSTGTVELRLYLAGSVTPISTVTLTGQTLSSTSLIGRLIVGRASVRSVIHTLDVDTIVAENLATGFPARPDLNTLSWDLSTDVPTVSIATVGASAVSTISDSAGWLREKRVAVAEGAPGAAQSSTVNLDLAGSSRFTYPGVPSAPGSPSNPGQYVATPVKPGGSSQAANWLFNVDLITSAPVIEYRANAVTAAPYLHIWVDGKRISQQATVLTATSGGGIGIKLTFAAAKRRRITVMGFNVVQGRWGGVAVGGAYGVTRPYLPITKRVAIIGDSYVNGAGGGSGGARSTETFAWKLAVLMGADEIIQAGIGGTGWVTQINAESASVFAGRVADVMAMSPHVVIVAGGRNDQTASDVQAAVEAFLDAVGSGVQRYVVRTSADGQAVNTAIAAAATSRSVPFLSPSVNALPKIADGIHPTIDGHEQFADAIYAAMSGSTPVPVSIDVPLLAVTATMTAPGLAAPAALPVPPATGAGLTAPPSVSAPAQLTVPPATGSGVAVPSSVSAGAQLLAPIVTGSAAIVAPGLSAGARVTVPTLAAALAVLAPGVTAGATESVPVPALPLSGQVVAPQLRAAATIQIPALTVGVQLTAPTVAASARLPIPGLQVTAAVGPVGMVTPVEIAIAAAVLLAVVLAPALEGGDTPPSKGTIRFGGRQAYSVRYRQQSVP